MQLRTIVLTLVLGLALLCGPSATHAQYQAFNLVSNQENTARTTDPLIVNAWGLVHGPGTPWWVSNNAGGTATLYSVNAAGTAATIVPLVVTIPNAPSQSAPDSPTAAAANCAICASSPCRKASWRRSTSR